MDDELDLRNEFVSSINILTRQHARQHRWPIYLERCSDEREELARSSV